MSWKQLAEAQPQPLSRIFFPTPALFPALTTLLSSLNNSIKSRGKNDSKTSHTLNPLLKPKSNFILTGYVPLLLA